MKRKGILLTLLAVLFLSLSLSQNLPANEANRVMQDTGCKIQDNRESCIDDRVSQGDPQLDKAEFAQKTKKLQIPFIANNGQIDERVKYYANTFGGTVFVTKDGEIVYALPNNSSDVETQCLASLMHSPNGRHNAEARIQDHRESCIVYRASVEGRTSDIVHPASWVVGRKSEFQNHKSTNLDSKNLKSGVALREEFVGARIKAIQGEDASVTKVNYFKGNDPEKWKTDISTYDVVNLGEIYKGIELKLKAYGDNVEKLFYVKPGASTEGIRLRLSGGKDFNINNKGELEVETELGTVKFTKPVAYQEINGKRVDISVEYRVESSVEENKSSKHKTCNSKLMSTNPKSKSEYGFKVASYDKTKELVIDPLLVLTCINNLNIVDSDLFLCKGGLRCQEKHQYLAVPRKTDRLLPNGPIVGV